MRQLFGLYKVIFDRRTNVLTIFFGLSVIMIITLRPYDFYFKETYRNLGYHIIFIGWGKSAILDVLENVMLFFPLGFGLTGYLTHSLKFARVASLVTIVLVSFGLSYTIEILQLFQPLRFSSLVDILSNCAGGILGFLSFIFLGFKCKVVGYDTVSKKKTLQLIFFGYAIFAILISIALQHFSGFSNWDKSFHLLLGNERTGDRPWSGRISEIYIADRAISEIEVSQIYSKDKAIEVIEKSLLASYRFNGIGAYHDKTGHLPDLVWNGKTRDIQQGESITLDSNNWLETVDPAIDLVKQITNTCQFTLSVTAATNKTIQTGPARIVSLSEDTDRRNLTLGQQGCDLVFRLRTPLTGENGGKPQLRVPNVFSTISPQNLTITYDGADILLYINGVRSPHAVKLNPGTILACNLFSLNEYNMICFKTFYYALIFIPLGTLMASIMNVTEKRFVIKIIIFSVFVLLTSFVFENILVGVSGRNLEWENMLISIVSMAIPIVFLIRTTKPNHAFAKRFTNIEHNDKKLL